LCREEVSVFDLRVKWNRCSFTGFGRGRLRALTPCLRLVWSIFLRPVCFVKEVDQPKMPPSDRTAMALTGFLQKRPLLKRLPKVRSSDDVAGGVPKSTASKVSHYCKARALHSVATFTKLRWLELIMVGLFLVWCAYSTKRSFGMLFSEAFCRTRKDTGCDSIVFRYKMFCKYLGDPLHQIIGFSLIPLPRWVSVLSVTINESSFPFDQVLWVHRHLGLIVVVGCSVHASGFLLDWTLESTIVSKLIPIFFADPAVDNRKFWGLAALLSIVVLYFCSMNAVRRCSFRLFYILHIVLSIWFILSVGLHFHGGTRFLRRIAIPSSLLLADYAWRGIQAWRRVELCACRRYQRIQRLDTSSGSTDSSANPSKFPFEVIGAHVVNDSVRIPADRKRGFVRGHLVFVLTAGVCCV